MSIYLICKDLNFAREFEFPNFYAYQLWYFHVSNQGTLRNLQIIIIQGISTVIDAPQIMKASFPEDQVGPEDQDVRIIASTAVRTGIEGTQPEDPIMTAHEDAATLVIAALR